MNIPYLIDSVSPLAWSAVAICACTVGALLTWRCISDEDSGGVRSKSDAGGDGAARMRSSGWELLFMYGEPSTLILPCTWKACDKERR